MDFKKTTILNLIFLGLFLPFFIGCWGGKPKITLSVTDCPVNDISITEDTRVVTQPGNQWTMTNKITVKCNGQAVKDAEIKIEFWWPKGTSKFKTDQNGEVSHRRNGHGSRPTGEKFTVTIKGNDGERPQEFTIQ